MGSAGLLGRIFWSLAALVVAVLVAVSLRDFVLRCQAPIRYRVGAIDGRFRVTANELRNALRRAEAVWEDPTKHDLFRYADDGELVVNLVYDTREQVTQENAGRHDIIERSTDSAGALRRKYEAANREYESIKRSFQTAQAARSERILAHRRAEDARNAGNASLQEHMEELRRESEAGAAANAEMERLRIALNAAAGRANELLERYNELADRVNENVDAINETAGRRYEQGLYAHDAGGIRIDVFEFFNQEDLVRVLAHEFGHALGAVHNRESDSIMFAMNQSGEVRLSASDVATLRASCGFVEPAEHKTDR